MEHEDIRQKLSAYLDNAVSVDEKAEIKRHLRSCGSCRGAIADLELTVGYLKTLPRIEPPPWLVAKIMAKVREISEPKSTLWQRLFFPLHLKLPLEALALVFLCITGYYLARTVGVQTPLTAPSTPQQQTPGPPSSSRAASPQLPLASGSRYSALPPKMAAPRSGTLPSPAAEQPPAPKHPELEPAPARPAEPASEPELRPEEEGPNFEREATPRLGREEKGVPDGAAKQAKKAVKSESSDRAVQAYKGEITLTVDDPSAAAGVIEEAVTRLGGRISGHSYGEKSHFLIIRIGTQKIPGLVERLGHIGTVLEKPQLSKVSGGTADLTIRW